MASTRVGVIGSGLVGQVLGAGFAALGHEVRIGSRTPQSEKLKAWTAKAGSRASTGSFADAASFGNLLVLATLWSGTEDALRLAGPEHFARKVVMDATNPLVVEQNAPPRLALGHTDSGGEQVQRWLPNARVVKAYNTVGNAHMVNPVFEGGPPTMFLCGNDPEAKRVVEGVCRDFGWEPLDVGGIDAARLLEPMCILWVMHGFRSNSWNHAFKLLRK